MHPTRRRILNKRADVSPSVTSVFYSQVLKKVYEAKGAIGHVQIEDSTTERCDRVKKTQKIARVYNGATMMCPTSIYVICV